MAFEPVDPRFDLADAGGEGFLGEAIGGLAGRFGGEALFERGESLHLLFGEIGELHAVSPDMGG